MPKITVTAPFNYAIGPTVKHYAKGEQDVPQAVAEHAAAHGFTAKPKTPTEPLEAKQ
ncbi:MAG: glycogen branching protein [Pseudomonas sp.]|nr:glycogen branching protein [Pseudomonas sp.]